MPEVTGAERDSEIRLGLSVLLGVLTFRVSYVQAATLSFDFTQVLSSAIGASIFVPGLVFGVMAWRGASLRARSMVALVLVTLALVVSITSGLERDVEGSYALQLEPNERWTLKPEGKLEVRSTSRGSDVGRWEAFEHMVVLILPDDRLFCRRAVDELHCSRFDPKGIPRSPIELSRLPELPTALAALFVVPD